MSTISPRTLQGFRDFLPETMIPRERIIETARHVFRSYGFSPIDTPALEYLEILTGKGGEETDRQLYRFEDHGGRKVGLRFDLTVPLARFVAQHFQRLGTPFKRYHIGTVWRGERAQRGRYREFMQCDFDTIGTRNLAADIEVALVIFDLMCAVGFRSFTVHVNNRKVLNGLLERLGLESQAVAILRALDKLAKIGAERVADELAGQVGCNAAQARQLLEFAQLQGSNRQILEQLGPRVAGSQRGQEGVGELTDLLSALEAAGLPAGKLRIDASIARGLDYYTGTIYETYLDDLPGIGSVCSGGRYDNLAGVYSKRDLPGVGASLGLDRLLAAMDELQMLGQVRTPAQVLVPYFDAARLHDYLRAAADLRRAGIATEVYPEPRKLGQQLKYADQRGFRFALIMGDQEFQAGNCQLKNLDTGHSRTLPTTDACRAVVQAVQEAT